MLHAKQWVALETEATEVLYGGAAGGGKSHLMREAAIHWCSLIPGLQVYLFRRQYGDLIKNHMDGPKGLRNMLAAWTKCGLVSIVKEEIRFWNGAKIHLCHCHNEKDVYNYQGAEIHLLLIDEITHFTEHMYRYLRGRVRMIGIELPKHLEKLRELFPRILVSGNPGGVGHLWVKKTWIDGRAPAAMARMAPRDGGMLRQFIPARLEDNPSMAQDDPLYEQRLEGLGSAALVKALRYGNWDVIEGAFFDMWDSQKHVIEPFVVPDEWIRFRSMDWGYASPFSVGWWAVVQDDVRARASFIENRWVTLPRGALVRYREWYGKSTDDVDNKGLRLDADVVAAGIVKRERDDPRLMYGVLDPSTFKHDTGPSIAERLNKVIIAARMPGFREADNTRVNRAAHKDRSGPMSGWDQMRARLLGIKGRPMIYCFSTCLDSIRTIPALQHDEKKAEDLNTNMEDHNGDDWRYACSSRPWLRTYEEKPKAKPAYESPKDQYEATSKGLDKTL